MAATATRSRTRKATANASKATTIKVTPDDFLRVIRFLDTQVLVERALELRVILLATLSGVNVHLLGPPGTAKSLALREFARCIEDAAYFEKALNAGMPPDAIIGSVDIPALTATGEYKLKVDGKLPVADVGFLDEWFRANGLMLDALLPLANTEERQYELNGHMETSGLAVLVSASNHVPDADNEQAQALVDRITLMCLVERVKADDSFEEIVRRNHARRVDAMAGAVKRETIHIEQVREAQRQVAHVKPTPDFLSKLSELRRNTAAEGLGVSDRRWVELVRVSRANAWLAGRDFLIPEDLAVVEHGLWRDPSDRANAHKLVLPFHGRFEREATRFRNEWAPVQAELEELRPTVEGTSPSQDMNEVQTPDGKNALLTAVSVSRRVDRLKADADAVLAEAEKEQRDAASLRDLANELLSAQMWFQANNLPTQLGRS